MLKLSTRDKIIKVLIENGEMNIYQISKLIKKDY